MYFFISTLSYICTLIIFYFIFLLFVPHHFLFIASASQYKQISYLLLFFYLKFQQILFKMIVLFHFPLYIKKIFQPILYFLIVIMGQIYLQLADFYHQVQVHEITLILAYFICHPIETLINVTIYLNYYRGT